MSVNEFSNSVLTTANRIRINELGMPPYESSKISSAALLALSEIFTHSLLNTCNLMPSQVTLDNKKAIIVVEYFCFVGTSMVSMLAKDEVKIDFNELLTELVQLEYRSFCKFIKA
jgi:hypothetical protein